MKFGSVSSEPDWPRPLAAVRVAHSAVTDSSEEPTLAEGTVIATHAARWFAASPQGNAVGRRRRAFLYTKFVLSREKDGEIKQLWLMTSYMSSLIAAAAKTQITTRCKCNVYCSVSLIKAYKLAFLYILHCSLFLQSSMSAKHKLHLGSRPLDLPARGLKWGVDWSPGEAAHYCMIAKRHFSHSLGLTTWQQHKQVCCCPKRQIWCSVPNLGSRVKTCWEVKCKAYLR